MILSAALMLEWLGDRRKDERCTAAARAINSAVETMLAKGPRSRDLGGTAGTKEVVAAVIAALPTK
jgi:3-isopropylmalate dehydrogenase